MRKVSKLRKENRTMSEAVETMADWADQYPAAVVEAADKFDKAHAAHQKAKGKLTTAKQMLIDVMEEHDCVKCPIRNGEKYVRLEQQDVVKIEKPKAEELPEPAGDVFDAAGE